MPGELLEVVNERDEVIGREMRSTVHDRGLLHRGVHVLLFTPQGGLIVQQRGPDKLPFPLALDCSISEHVKAGEGYRAAARRGLQEELGLVDVRFQPLVKFRMTYGPGDEEISTLYEGRIDPARVQYDPGEVLSVAAYRLDEIVQMISDGEVPFCGWFVQIMRWYLYQPSELQVLKSYQRGRLLDG
jgi:isopentenyldiphosphate isomerase